MASDDLTARLLARTEELARAGTWPAGSPAPASGTRGFRPATAGGGAGGRRARQPPTALLGGSAYLMGGDRRPGRRRRAGLGLPAAGPCCLRGCCRRGRDRRPGRPPAGASPANRISPRPGRSRRRSSPPCAPRAGPAPSSANSATTWSGPGPGCWPAATSWSCGSPTAGTSPPSWNSTVACPGSPARPGGGPQTLAAPVNVLTGRPATSDGFTSARVPAAMTATGAGAGTGRGMLWVNHAAPFAAIYQAGDATFTYVSDQPAEQADDGVAALVRASSAAADRPPARRTRAGPASRRGRAQFHRAAGARAGQDHGVAGPVTGGTVGGRRRVSRPNRRSSE